MTLPQFEAYAAAARKRQADAQADAAVLLRAAQHYETKDFKSLIGSLRRGPRS